MMTLERAAELVSRLREVKEMEGRTDDDSAQDLFSHFVEYFGLPLKGIYEFAHLCGYPVAFDLNIYAH